MKYLKYCKVLSKSGNQNPLVEGADIIMTNRKRKKDKMIQRNIKFEQHTPLQPQSKENGNGKQLWLH